MNRLPHVFLILIISVIASCGSTPQPIALGPLSKGGQLIIETKLLSPLELKQIVDTQTANNSNTEPKVSTDNEAANPFASSDFLFGSGLVSSAVFFTETGAFVSPSNFMNKADLGMWILAGLLDNSMKYHPSMYYHFYVRNCEDKECFEEKFAAFANDYIDLFVNTDAAKNSPYGMAEREISLSNFAIDQVKVKVRDNADKLENITVSFTLVTYHMSKINKDLNIWGNDQVRKSPDRLWVSKSIGDIQNSHLLSEASAKHPDILLYIPIDRKRIENGQPCFGGFFIGNGEYIPVDEFSCVKMDNRAI